MALLIQSAELSERIISRKLEEETLFSSKQFGFCSASVRKSQECDWRFSIGHFVYIQIPRWLKQEFDVILLKKRTSRSNPLSQ
jgi:hypothetical protein